ncbi:MAG: hypothetical protein H7A21_01455 [Spirochaetales bacterium]|nr:hypothetical protein [Leptospiraceae bacterium]MCP5480074.1 hypothetical protein [Spirochaetales bacterium]MCP5485585.1 hypothetical protein [Spirochaetales bacterium]
MDWLRVRSPSVSRRALIAPLALFLALLALPTEAAWARQPIHIVDESPREYWQFWFLYEQTRAAGQFQFTVHPLYSRYENDERAYDYQNVLYPLFYSHGTDHWRRWTLLYFITGEDFYHEDEGGDEDYFLTPFFHLGFGDAEGERYFSIFPFYGTVRNKLGWSEISYVLWPLYTSWSYRDYRARSILWPLIMWGGSPTRDDLRILPFYSHKIHQGQYDHRTLLWPFFQWGSDGLDRREPRHFFLAFPFYGRKWSDQDNLNVHTFLWLPLIGGFAAWGEDREAGNFNMNALWFLYQYGYARDPHIDKHIIFPFWGHYRFGSEQENTIVDQSRPETNFPAPPAGEDNPYFNEATFITPFYVNLRTHSAILESDYDIFVPFYWNLERYYHRTRETESYLKIWPLFHSINDDSGRTEFRTLALWPFRSDEFERVWGTLYSLLEYNQYENGDRYFATLWRLYSLYWNAEEVHHFLLGFEYHRTPSYWSVQFLGGLFGLRHDHAPAIQPRTTVSLFWYDL